MGSECTGWQYGLNVQALPGQSQLLLHTLQQSVLLGDFLLQDLHSFGDLGICFRDVSVLQQRHRLVASHGFGDVKRSPAISVENSVVSEVIQQPAHDAGVASLARFVQRRVAAVDVTRVDADAFIHQAIDDVSIAMLVPGGQVKRGLTLCCQLVYFDTVLEKKRHHIRVFTCS